MDNIIRVEKDKDNPYVMVNKEYLEDIRLSFKAKGLMTYLLSRPNDWKTYVSQLKKVSTEGRDSVGNAMNELMKYDYIIRKENDKIKGKYTGYNYTVIERPKNHNGLTVTDKPITDKPCTENPILLINDSTDNDITNIKKKKETPVKHKHGEYKHVQLTEDQYNTLIKDYGIEETEFWIKKVDEGIEMKGYKYTNHYLVIKKWRGMNGEGRQNNQSSFKRNAGEALQNKTNGQEQFSTTSTEIKI